MSAVKPIILALVLCDQIIREVGTNKLSLIGTFNGIYAASFPINHPSLWVYIAITEGRGTVPCKLRMVSMDNSVVFDLPGQIEFGGPATVGELVFQLQQLRFENPGVYSIEFWAGDDLLASRRVNVQMSEQRPESTHNA
ncbi:MAG TPA: hypothetical protein VEJ63_16875 [Planctomycetota bacterium]|nr:hypothetical protein [Planctomycetota bacterium]